MSRNPITDLVSQRPTISANQAYQANDAIGGVMQFTIPVESTVNGGGGMALSLVIIDLLKQNPALVVFFFDTAIAGTADNAAFAPSAAELLTCIGHVIIAATDYQAAGANGSIVTKAPLDFALAPPDSTGAKTIYAQAMVTGTPTYTATNQLMFRLGQLAD